MIEKVPVFSKGQLDETLIIMRERRYFLIMVASSRDDKKCLRTNDSGCENKIILRKRKLE